MRERSRLSERNKQEADDPEWKNCGGFLRPGLFVRCRSSMVRRPKEQHASVVATTLIRLDQS